MAERITNAHLDKLLSELNFVIPGNGFTVGGAYGGFRVERKGGSVDVSPRGTKRECYYYLSAMLEAVRLSTLAHIREREAEAQVNHRHGARLLQPRNSHRSWSHS
jgi:hypothetical protein